MPSPVVLAPPRARRAINRLLASLSHEMRTPLNAIINMGALLRENRRGGLHEEEVRWAERIGANGAHLLGIVEQLLELMRLEAGECTIESERVSAAAVLRRAVEQAAAQPPATDVAIVAAVPEREAMIVADSERLQRALVAMLLAAAAETPCGSVTARLRTDARTGRALGIDIVATRRAGVSPVPRPEGESELALALARLGCERMGFDFLAAPEPDVAFRITLAADAR